MHRETRVIYRYYNLTQAVENYPQIECDILLRGVIFNQGVLYEKEQSTLKQEIAQRNRSFKKEYFSEEEIVNTFVPLFEGLKQLHDEGVVHGGITLDSIVIVEGEVRLRDWLGNTNETRSL
jgi:tRNA A-37 threonylcarbamoyl transferase component Bud32